MQILYRRRVTDRFRMQCFKSGAGIITQKECTYRQIMSLDTHKGAYARQPRGHAGRSGGLARRNEVPGVRSPWIGGPAVMWGYWSLHNAAFWSALWGAQRECGRLTAFIKQSSQQLLSNQSSPLTSTPDSHPLSLPSFVLFCIFCFK